jgi:hypothetical protein
MAELDDTALLLRKQEMILANNQIRHRTALWYVILSRVFDVLGLLDDDNSQHQQPVYDCQPIAQGAGR